MKVHQDRNTYTAVMVGTGTALKDNPLLTCRIPGGRNPVRIICDTHLRTPLEANVVTTAKEARTMIVTCCQDRERYTPYIEKSCEILTAKEKDGHVDLMALMNMLGKAGIDSILLEGGATLNWSALEAGI